MKIIPTTPNPSGAYPAIQEGDYLTLPEGCALWPDELDTGVFYEYNGFVTLTVKDAEVVVGQETVELPPEEGGGEITTELRDVTELWPVVDSYEPDAEAWEAWKASLPEPEEESESEEEVTTAEMAAAVREGVDAV